MSQFTIKNKTKALTLIYNNFRNIELPSVDSYQRDWVVISDPPYNIGFNYNNYKDGLSEVEYIDLIKDITRLSDKIVLIGYPDQFYRYYIQALGYPDFTVAWCYNSNLAQQFRLIGFWNVDVDLNADKQPYKNPNDKRIKELMKNGSEGAKLYNWWSDIQLVKNVTKERENNIHPCPVPVKLMQRIIKVTNNGKYTYVDPFNGSGTSARACYRENVDFIGYEIDKDYYDNSIELLKKEQVMKDEK